MPCRIRGGDVISGSRTPDEPGGDATLSRNESSSEPEFDAQFEIVSGGKSVVDSALDTWKPCQIPEFLSRPRSAERQDCHLLRTPVHFSASDFLHPWNQSWFTAPAPRRKSPRSRSVAPSVMLWSATVPAVRSATRLSANLSSPKGLR